MEREERITLAKELRSSGLSYAKIGKRLGVGDTTVRRWVNHEYAEKRREANRKYRQSEKGREKVRECGRRRRRSRKGQHLSKHQLDQQVEYRQSTTHPETTYFIGSPDCSRIVIGTTTNWEQRYKHAYNKSLFPLKLLGMTRIPENVIHDRFRHLQVPGYSREVFHLRPELQAFIDQYCWPQLFRYSEPFVGEPED